MARELKVDVDLLEQVSKVWLNEVAPELAQTAGEIDPLKYTVVQFGPLFFGMWDSYTGAAEFIQKRLNEAKPVAEQIGNALHTAATSFALQQEQQVQETEKLKHIIENSGN
ncbi:hypothetical protein [Nocardia brasiliensis]|uniref:Uncharacterized protein n=1 Tax=Nocardia brasiliensis (strain ATCC 700358 / HUJEG-1) TaxID=1133849 RepID=K0EWU1_NOCB7|nr:hypothetical protein [Nocardia brasiliensis]AFU04283.1 hypothetical protein O3I_031670 [Nocardia brasiliensis ATCC 700358]OCF91426.1 hypothetical protein AW168_06545 [Nocardia brasiliensis]